MGNLDENQKFKVSSFFEKNKFPKYIYLVVGVLLVLIIITVELNIYLNFKKNTKKIGIKPVEITNEVISKSIIKWLDSRRDQRGMYWSSQNCLVKNQSDCKEDKPSNYNGIPVIWGMNGYYLLYRDSNILSLIKRDIKNYANEKINPAIGATDLSCKLIDEVKNNSDLNDDDKRNLDIICLKTEYPDQIIYNDFKLTNEDIKLLSIVKIKNFLYSDKDNLNIISEQYTNVFKKNMGLDNYPNFVSEYVYKDKLIKKGDYLRKSYFAFDISLEAYFSNSIVYSKNEFGCNLGRAALDLNKLESKSEYIELSKKMFNLHSNDNSLSCVLLANELYLETKDKKFLDYKNDYLENYVRRNFEGSVKDGGFVSFQDDENLIRDVRKNGLIVGILSK